MFDVLVEPFRNDGRGSGRRNGVSRLVILVDVRNGNADDDMSALRLRLRLRLRSGSRAADLTSSRACAASRHSLVPPAPPAGLGWPPVEQQSVGIESYCRVYR
jgi:hypothetical protein